MSPGKSPRWLVAMWDGLRLTCPNCRRGRMYRDLNRLHERCEACGVLFEREEGEFVGAMVVAYGVLALLILAGIAAVEAVTDLGLTAHLVIWGLFSLLFLWFGYRNCKGIWIGLLHATLGLKKERSST